MKTIITILFAVLSMQCMAQGISGTVVDEKKEPVISAVVQVYSQSGILMGGNVTDFDGNYMIKPLESGKYTVLVRFQGYDTATVTGVLVNDATITTQNFGLKKTGGARENVIKQYRVRLVNSDDQGL